MASAAPVVAPLRDERRFALIVAALFLAVTVPVMLRHELWRDEAQAWLLARDAPSVAALLHLLHYEGHPALWYLVLRPLALAGAGVRAMQLLALAAGCGAAYLFARCAPFSRVLRLVFAFGYFVAYAYTVVARSYSIGLLLAIAICVILTRPSRGARARPASIGWAAAAGGAMFLLANVSVYGAIIVIALTIALVVAGADERARFAASCGSARTSLVLTLAWIGIAVSVAQLRTPRDAPFRGEGLVVNSTSRALGAESLLLVWRAYVPIPNVERLSDLGSSDAFASRSPRATMLAIALSGAMIVLAAYLMRASRMALAFYLAATTGLVVFSLAIFPGTLYHFGHLYLALVMGAWIAGASARGAGLDASGSPQVLGTVHPHAETLLGALMLLQVIGAVPRLVGDVLYPYSGARGVADYLRAHALDRGSLVASPAYVATPVSAYLNRPIAVPGFSAPITYLPQARRRPHLTDAQLLVWARACCLGADSSAILLLGHPLSAPDSALRVTALARFAPTIIDENYYIYALREAPR